MSTRIMYIVVAHHEINGKLCSHGGKICYITPNYSRIYPEPIETTDGNSYCHAIEVDEKDIKEVQNGTATEHYFWRGPKDRQDTPLDAGTIPIYHAGTAPSAESAASEADVPPQVRLAAAVSALSDEELDSWPNMGKSSIKEWRDRAQAVQDEHISQKSGD